MQRKPTPLQSRILAVITGLGANANGATIARVFERCGHTFNGGLYTALHAMERKKLIVSTIGEGEPRGGRPKRYYKVVQEPD